MTNQSKAIELVHISAKKRLLFLPHAVRQMSRTDRMISTTEVRNVIEKGEIIEDYPEDARGHSCLMLGHGDDERPIHVVCSPKDDYLAIITAYLPDPKQWEDNFRTRR
jgi:hypothetical protein